jgi:sec-independent protein translocase protein TatC
MSDEPESDDGDPVGPDEDTTPESDPDVDSSSSPDHDPDDRTDPASEAGSNVDPDGDTGATADRDTDADEDEDEDANANANGSGSEAPSEGNGGASNSGETAGPDGPSDTADEDDPGGDGGRDDASTGPSPGASDRATGEDRDPASAGEDATDGSVPPHDRAGVEVPTPRPDHHRDRDRGVEADDAGDGEEDVDTDGSATEGDDDEGDDEAPSYARLGTESDSTDHDPDPTPATDDENAGDADAGRPSDDALAGYDPAEDDVVATDGEGASAGATVDAAAPAVEDDEYTPSYLDEGVVDGPEDDVEMPLTDHIEEMIRRLAVVFFVGGLVTLFLFPGSDLTNFYLGTDLPTATNVINHLWDKHIPGTAANPERRPRLYGPLELVLTELKVAGLGGLVFGLPAFVYETYLFMRPGLYPKERRYYLAAVPTSVVLAAIGVAFAHFAVLPAIFAYFTSYTTGTAVVAFGLAETFNLIIILMGYMAIVFQIPLFIMLAIMMDLVTSQWLRERRLLFWGAFLGISFIATPDPTGMAPIIVGATMIVLFEGTLGALRYTRH